MILNIEITPKKFSEIILFFIQFVGILRYIFFLEVKNLINEKQIIFNEIFH